MRLSSGSPLLAAVVATLPELLSRWMAEDWGVDEEGIYELVITDDLCPCAEFSPFLEASKGRDADFCAWVYSHGG